MTTRDTRLRLDDDAIVQLAMELCGASEAARARGRRFVLGVAGVAGSGKSTLAQRLVGAVNAAAVAADFAVYAPMDGFHLSNAALQRQGWIDRKGAPLTYDAAGYLAMLQHYRDRLHVGDVPVYSRREHEPVPSDSPVTHATSLLIAEGQYLLLTDEPWCGLADVLDQTWWLDTPEDAAKRWTIQRHIDVGRTPQHAVEKYERNDGPNSRLVREHRRDADRVVFW